MKIYIQMVVVGLTVALIVSEVIAGEASFFEIENRCLKTNIYQCDSGIAFISLFGVQLPIPGRFKLSETILASKKYESESFESVSGFVNKESIVVGEISGLENPLRAIDSSYKASTIKNSQGSYDAFSKKINASGYEFYSVLVTDDKEYLIYTGGNQKLVETIMSFYE